MTNEKTTTPALTVNVPPRIAAATRQLFLAEFGEDVLDDVAGSLEFLPRRLVGTAADLGFLMMVLDTNYDTVGEYLRENERIYTMYLIQKALRSA